jgi:hypothetical protein
MEYFGGLKVQFSLPGARPGSISVPLAATVGAMISALDDLAERAVWGHR